MLTMTQAVDSNDTTTDSDSFDFTQMTFETFAEVIFRLFYIDRLDNHTMP